MAAKKMPGAPRNPAPKPREEPATGERLPAREGAPRKLEDIPKDFRKPSAPPGRKQS